MLGSVCVCLCILSITHTHTHTHVCRGTCESPGVLVSVLYICKGWVCVCVCVCASVCVRLCLRVRVRVWFVDPSAFSHSPPRSPSLISLRAVQWHFACRRCVYHWYQRATRRGEAIHCDLDWPCTVAGSRSGPPPSDESLCHSQNILRCCHTTGMKFHGSESSDTGIKVRTAWPPMAAHREGGQIKTKTE